MAVAICGARLLMMMVCLTVMVVPPALFAVSQVWTLMIIATTRAIAVAISGGSTATADSFMDVFLDAQNAVINPKN